MSSNGGMVKQRRRDVGVLCCSTRGLSVSRSIQGPRSASPHAWQGKVVGFAELVGCLALLCLTAFVWSETKEGKGSKRRGCGWLLCCPLPANYRAIHLGIHSPSLTHPSTHPSLCLSVSARATALLCAETPAMSVTVSLLAFCKLHISF